MPTGMALFSIACLVRSARLLNAAVALIDDDLSDLVEPVTRAHCEVVVTGIITLHGTEGDLDRLANEG